MRKSLGRVAISCIWNTVKLPNCLKAYLMFYLECEEKKIQGQKFQWLGFYGELQKN